jgi:DNA-binding CsgD family transcriptional regulator
MRPRVKPHAGPTRRGEVVRVEREEGKGPEEVGKGPRQGFGRTGADFGGQRAGYYISYPVPGEDRAAEAPSLDPERVPISWVNWQSALYMFVLALSCVFLVPLTAFWWVVPLLGVAGPLALAALQRSGSVPEKPDSRGSGERELLKALAERGEMMTPAAAAMRTSLTVDEASRVLDGLAAGGHLEPRTEDGVVAYLLPGYKRLPARDGAHEIPRARPGAEADSAQRLDDPLSERELEVLALLASGRTNAEIARDLFVALGTVKSHVNNIYRKLSAANRAEAATRAREMRLLR